MTDETQKRIDEAFEKWVSDKNYPCADDAFTAGYLAAMKELDRKAKAQEEALLKSWRERA